VSLDTESNLEKTKTSSGSASQEKLEQLRSVLLAPQEKIIADLESQVQQLEARLVVTENQSVVTNESLVDDINNARKSGDELGMALKPIVIDKFHQASRDDPDTMADALFPILGPAVRKMIVNMITPDKKAKRFGYQVEQLFLIDKNTGLPICHVASDVANTQDADMVSGMLSAIQSFVHDAFETNEFDGLNTMQVGELSVWIEWGPKAILAAVVRGAPPQRLRDAMQLKIEQIHREFESQLGNYDGSSESFEHLKPGLLVFLDSHDGSLISSAKNLSVKTKRNLLIAGAALALLLAWYAYLQHKESQWSEFIKSLEAAPGIVVTSSREEGGINQIFGLRDPLSKSPRDILKNSDIDRNVEFLFEPYLATNSEIIERRANALLRPPQNVKIAVNQTTLYVSGSASQDWITTAKPISNRVYGADLVIFNVRQVDLSE